MLGTLKQELRDKGREIFRDTQKKRKYADGSAIPSCASCHPPLSRDNLTARIAAQMTPLKLVGTDIWMACNAVTHSTLSGALFQQHNPKGKSYGASAPIADLLVTTVTYSILGNPWVVIRGVLGGYSTADQSRLGPPHEQVPSPFSASERPVRSAEKQDLRNRCLNGTEKHLAYKGRPLTGIWATAPYLHNGSVPTLYDLLLPPDQRPKAFAIGTREFDTKRVGFVTRAADGSIAKTSDDSPFWFRTRDDAGRVIDGNSNAGHDYGNALLSEDERWALVEYMKGL